MRALLVAGLLDELSLNICPVVVGSGMHLFDEVTKTVRLTVAHSTVLSNGVIGVTYQPARAGAAGDQPPIDFPRAAANSAQAGR